MDLIHNVVKSPSAREVLLLAHGYGADESDLGGLVPYLDPEGRFAVVLPRGPHASPGTPGYSWYGMPGMPGMDAVDPREHFGESLAALDELLDAACDEHGFGRAGAVVGGFSQGAGLSLALGVGPELDGERPRPRAVLALSPFLPGPEVLGLGPQIPAEVPVLVQHGSNDPLIPVQRSRDLARALRAAGVPTVYREYPMEHQVALESLQDARDWLHRVMDGERPDEEVPPDPVELVRPVTTAEWEAEVLRSETPVIVDFWAPWCAPCRQVSPVVETIAAMRPGSYKVVKVNIDEEPELARRYDIQSIPMIGLFRDGRLERASLGAKPRQQIEAELGMLVIP